MSREGPLDRFDDHRHHIALGRAADALSAREPELWAVAVGALLLDLGLTLVGLELGLAERNLLASGLMASTGVVGLGLVKTAALAVALAARSLLPPRFVFVVPLGLAVPWLVASVVNLVVIAQVLDVVG